MSRYRVQRRWFVVETNLCAFPTAYWLTHHRTRRQARREARRLNEETL